MIKLSDWVPSGQQNNLEPHWQLKKWFGERILETAGGLRHVTIPEWEM